MKFTKKCSMNKFFFHNIIEQKNGEDLQLHCEAPPAPVDFIVVPGAWGGIMEEKYENKNG